MTSTSLTTTRAGVATPPMPVERYRGIASVMLILMILIAALAPLGTTAPSVDHALPTEFNARPSSELGARLFDYVAESGRQPVVPPLRQGVLRESPQTSYGLLSLAANILIESSGTDPNTGAPDPPHPLRDAALGGGVERWNNMDTFYSSIRDAWAVNGKGAVAAMRATTVSGEEQKVFQQQAVDQFRAAALLSPDKWFYLYNWGVGEMMRGNYQQAALLFNTALRIDPNQPVTAFHLGLALLRLGEPEQALGVWGGSAANPDPEWGRPTSEGLADALAARGDGSDAVDGYMRIQSTIDAVDWGLYEKIIALQLLRGPDSLLGTITTLADRFPDEPRLHYDRARVLMMLGRSGAADSALRRASELRPDEPAFYVARAQLALGNGKPADALQHAETALQKVGIDLQNPNLEFVYARLENNDRYQQSFAQQIIEANLARASAWRDLNRSSEAQTLAENVLAQGGSDPARAAWFRYYAGLIYSAGGLQSSAQGIFLDGMQTEGVGPGKGALALAWVRSLAPAEISDQHDDILTALGGTLQQPAPAADISAAYAYYELAEGLYAGGRTQEVGPLYRAAAAWEVGQRNASNLPALSPTGTLQPVELEAAEADYLLQTGQYELAATRYQQLLNVEPSAVGAHTNRGIALYRQGDEVLARREFELATRLDAGNTLAQHNLGIMALRGGVGDILTALNAFGAARVAGGPEALRLETDLLAAPQSVGLPTPPASTDFMIRIPALLALVLLLLHTLIFSRRESAEQTSSRNPQGGLLGTLGETLANRVPALGVVPTIAIAVVIGGLAWGFSSNYATWTLNSVIGFGLIGILAALVAIGAQEGAQFLALRREKQAGTITERLWPLGLLISVIGAPFGLVYGWTLATNAAGGSATADDAVTAAPVAAITPARPATRSKRTSQPVSGQAKATATAAAVASEERLPWRGWGALGPAARIAAAGLLANLVLAILFGLLYGFFGHPLWRLMLLANVAVLAFTAVSEPPAEGWQLWRRSPLLWLLLFLLSASALTALLLRVV